MPRRKPRQLTQKVRIGGGAEQPTADAVETQPEVARSASQIDEPAPFEQDEAENRDNGNMPRRSRRSPRHLRVSGQRRRRYRDERYPSESAMPLAAAAASPEMASGKVWVRYPVAQPVEMQAPQQDAPVSDQQETAGAIALPVAAAEAAPSVADTAPQTTGADVQQGEAQHLPQPNVAEAGQAKDVQQAEPQAETPVALVNTDNTAPIEAPVNHEPAVIPAADEAVAEAIAEQAVPAAPMVEEATPAADATEIAAESAHDVTPEAEAQVEEVLNAPVAAERAPEPLSEPHAPVPARDAAPQAIMPQEAAVRFTHHASAPMTKAPAPAWQPEPARHSDWVRAPFAFEGKGAAGGHSATHQATAPATRPESA